MIDLSLFSFTQKGNTALHISSLAGQAEVVKVLSKRGADINAQSQVSLRSSRASLPPPVDAITGVVLSLRDVIIKRSSVLRLRSSPSASCQHVVFLFRMDSRLCTWRPRRTTWTWSGTCWRTGATRASLQK